MPKSKPPTGNQTKSAATRKANIAQTANDVATTVNKTLPAKRESYHLTDDQEQWALDRLSAGDLMKNVTRDLGVSKACLYVRAYKDPDGFGAKLATAMEIGCFQRLENAEDMILAGELSTGSIERDREYMKYAQWMAARLNRRTFGDRVAVDARNAITVVLPHGPDWDGFD